MIKYESYIKDLEERESLLAHRVSRYLVMHPFLLFASHVNKKELKPTFSTPKVQEHTLTTKAVQQEAALWRKACELEVEAGKSAIKELNQEVI